MTSVATVTLGAIMYNRYRPMFLLAADAGGGAGTPPVTDPPAPAADPDPSTDPPAGDPAGAQDPPADKTFSQADVDRIVQQRLAKHSKDLDAYAEREKLDDAERLRAEKADADAAVAEAKREAVAARVEVAAERAALAAGVKPERVQRFLKLVDLDLDEVTDDGKVNSDAVSEAVLSTLTDVPEFKGAAPAPGGGAPGGADFDGTGGSVKQWTAAEIASLSPAEYKQHQAEILAQMRAGKIQA